MWKVAVDFDMCAVRRGGNVRTCEGARLPLEVRGGESVENGSREGLGAQGGGAACQHVRGAPSTHATCGWNEAI